MEALAAAKGSDVVLVVIEIELPDMTGYEVCHAIREELGEELPIVFVSGIRTEPLDKIAGLLLGADDYIVKPIDPNELLARSGASRRGPPCRRRGTAMARSSGSPNARKKC